MHKPTARSRYLVLSIYIKFHLRFLIHWASNHISFRLFIFVFGPELQLLTRLQLLAESKVVKIDIKVYSQLKNLTTWVDAIYIAVHCKLLSVAYPGGEAGGGYSPPHWPADQNAE